MPDQDDYRPPRGARHSAPAPAAPRPGVGERISQDLGRGAAWVGHKAWDVTLEGVRQGAAHPAEFAPFGFGAALYAAALGDQDAPALSVPMVVTALAVAGYLLYRRHRERGESPAWRETLRRAYYAFVYAASIATLCMGGALTPRDPAVLEMIGAATLAAGGAWWTRARRTGAPADETPEADEPDAEPVEEVDLTDLEALRAQIQAWWQAKVTPTAPKRGFIPGSAILDLNVDEHASRLHVQLDGDEMDFSELEQRRKRLASSRGTSKFNVQVKKVPDEREDQAIITIFHRNPLPELVPFPGPSIDLATGCAVVGRCDDLSPALIRFWEPGSGTWHELVCGASGSGKSRYLDQALINERHCLDEYGRHLIVSWIMDPQNGQSLPDWQDRVDRFARTPAECMAMLEEVRAEMFARNLHLAQKKWTDAQDRERTGVSHFTPSADMPILSVTIDESPTLLADPRFKDIIKRILGMARKCGIRLRLVTQIPSISELGNDFNIRPLIAAMCLVCLRTVDAITGGAFPGLPGDPKKDLPEFFPDGSRTFGLGYILGAVKAAMFRTFALDENVVYDWATAGTTAHLIPLAAKPGAGSDAPAAAPTARLADHRVAESSEAAPEPGPVGTARQLIRAYFAHHPGPTTSGTLVAELGLNNSTVSQALRREVEDGRLTRITHGVYAPAGTDPGMWRDQDDTQDDQPAAA